MEVGTRRRLAQLTWAALVALGLTASLSRCGTAVTMWPLRRGQAVAAFDLGGPFVNVSGAQIPIPYPVARLRYGLSDRLNLNAGAHLMMPAFGVAGFDVGASYHFLDQNGWWPCLGIGAGELGLVEFDGVRATSFLPQLEITASYMRPNHSLSYFGVHTLYEVSPNFFMTYSPYVGHNFSVGRNLSVSLEMKWYAASVRNKPRTVTYPLPIANHGGLGVVAGVAYHFGGWYR